MPEADNEIRIKYSLDASSYLAAFEQIRGSTQDFQSDLIEVANQLQITYKEAGEVMVQALEDAQEAKNALLREEGGLQAVTKGQLDIQKAELSEYKSEVTKAVSELNKLSADSAKTQQDRSRELNKVRQEQLKATQQVEKETVKASLAVQREYAKVTQQGYGVMSAGAKEYGKVIQRTRKILEDTTKRSGKSLEEVASRMQRLGVPANQINQALKEMRNDAKQAVQVLQALQKINLGATRVQFQQTRDATVSFLNAMRGAHQATQPFTERLRGLVTNLSNFGQVGSFVFGSVLGVTAVTAIQRVTRAFVDFAQEILRRGTEMTEVIFTLEVAIRGLQRVGLDTTIESWTGRIQELKKEFPFFPRREFIEATSLAALMTREFGFTEAQIANIVRQSAILAQITGKDLLESVRGITFAIGSGYFESLQRAGVNISRQVVATEALAQGYEGVYNELEPTIRASVTYSVIQNNLNAIQEDASRRAEIFAGQVQVLTSRLEDLKNLFGDVVTASDSLIESLIILNDLLESITDIYETLSRLEIDIFAPFKELTGLETIIRNIETLAVTLEGLNNMMSTLIDNAKTFGAILGAIGSVAGAFGLDFVSQVFEDLDEKLTNVSRSLGDLEQREEIEIKIRIGETEFSEEDYKKIVEITQEANDEILEIEEEGLEKRQDIIEDYQRDIEDGWERHLRKLEDLQRDLSRRLADIDLKERQRISDEVADNAFRVQEAIRKASLRREEAERKFREREISAERKFQEKLRQLRENFLLDLEDAVRERDARQIIRLTRQYNLRRDQMIREEKLSKDDHKTQFEEELRQIEQQRQERLRQLAVEHQRRLESIALQAERERQQAQIDFERRQQAEQERFDREKEDRDRRLQEQFDDLEQSIQDRINKVIQGLEEEYDLSQEKLDAIAKLYETTYGPNSRIDNALVWFMQRLQQARAMMQTFRLERLQGMTFIPPGFSGEGVGYAGEQAEGGTIIARKPTVALFGEAGPEMATFTPLSKLGTQGTTAKITPMGDSMPRDGRIQLEMLLSPDLEARVVDNTLGELADINFAIEKARK